MPSSVVALSCAGGDVAPWAPELSGAPWAPVESGRFWPHEVRPWKASTWAGSCWASSPSWSSASAFSSAFSCPSRPVKQGLESAFAA